MLYSIKRTLMCASLLLPFIAAQAQQTSTLSQLESSNTSAPPGFTGTVTRTDGAKVDNGLPPVRPISDLGIHSLITSGNPKVFVHLQGWFCPSSGNACDGHVVLGYDDHDPTHVQAQLDDMRRRGLDGALVDWYGPSSFSDQTAQLYRNYADQICAAAGNPSPCPFQIGFVIDAGASEYKSCGSSCTSTFVNDVNYIFSNYYTNHPSGARASDGRPIIANFDLQTKGIDFNAAHGSLSSINPYFEFNGASAMNSTAGSDGAFEWDYPQADPNNDNSAGVSSFYANFPAGKLPIGTGYTGFDDSAAAWGKGRKMNRRCGKTWLQIVGDLNGHQSVPVNYLQFPTWDDYEEGSELETGIDNCLQSVTGTVNGDTLNLNLAFGAQPFDVNPQPADVGDTSSLSRYDVWYTAQDPSQVSDDSQVSLTLAGSVPSANGTAINLASSSLNIPSGTQLWLFINAVGQPFIQNHINTRANAIPYYKSGTGGGGSVTLSPASNNYGSVAVGSTSAAVSFTLSNGTSSALSNLTHTVAGQFKQQSTTCSASLGAGSSCTISAAFAPTTAGVQNGSLTASYTGGSQAAQLSGNGQSSGGGIDDGAWTCSGNCAPAQPDTATSLDGSSVQFSYIGGAAYSGGRWSTTLANSYSTTSQFKLDFWAYTDNPGASQALEITADQVVGGREYPFQVQCDFKGSKLWRVWDPVSQTWIGTTVGCSPLSASTWNHFTLDFSRNSSSQLYYKDIIINNVTYSFGLTEGSIANTNAASMDIDVRLDGDATPDTYSFLIDEMTLSQPATTGATNIDDGGGWSCSGSCASAVADTAIQHDGSSEKFTYTGGGSYTNGTWAKTLTNDFSTANNYTYDFWAYVQSPGASQAVEFAADQVTGGKEYPFQVQCDFLGSKLWRVWNPASNLWVNTSVGCSPFSANTWNHFILHFSRTSGNQLFYQDLVINGSTYNFNLYENAIGNSNAASMKVRVKLDGNSSGASYAAWLDQFSLTF